MYFICILYIKLFEKVLKIVFVKNPFLRHSDSTFTHYKNNVPQYKYYYNSFLLI